MPQGLSFVPQEKNVFTSMSVEENLEMGAFTRTDDFTGTIEWVYDMFPVLHGKAPAAGGRTLGRPAPDGGDGPGADEPAASCCCSTSRRPGCRPRYVLEIFEQIVKVNKAGVGILMVEQNARQALAFASRGFVLAQGQNRFTGTGAELIADPEVAKSFLGG